MLTVTFGGRGANEYFIEGEQRNESKGEASLVYNNAEAVVSNPAPGWRFPSFDQKVPVATDTLFHIIH